MLRKSASKLFALSILAALIFLTAPILAQAYRSPGSPKGHINDFAGVLPAGEISSIEVKLRALRSATGVEVAIATVKSLEGDTVENFATKLFEEWGIGDEEKDRGLLILVAPKEREVRIEVGYGLEGAVTDLQSGNIIRKVMLPAFAAGNYAAGISGAVDAVTSIITGSANAEEFSRPLPARSQSGDFNFGAVIFFLFIVFNVMARILGRTKSWWLGGVIGAGVGTIVGFIWGFLFAGLGAIVLLTIFGLLFDYLVSKGGGKGGGGFFPPFFGGFGGGHGGAGGFGGFGGGMSGGGGASGRW